MANNKKPNYSKSKNKRARINENIAGRKKTVAERAVSENAKKANYKKEEPEEVIVNKFDDTAGINYDTIREIDDAINRAVEEERRENKRIESIIEGIKKAVGEQTRAEEVEPESFEEGFRKVVGELPKDDPAKKETFDEGIKKSMSMEHPKEEHGKKVAIYVKDEDEMARDANAEKKAKKAERKDVRRKVNAMVNDAFSAPKREEKARKKEDKIRYKNLVEMAKNMDLSDFEEIPNIEELLEILKKFEPKEVVDSHVYETEVEHSKTSEPQRAPAPKNMAYEEEEIKEDSIEDLIEMLKRFEPKEPVTNANKQKGEATKAEKRESVEELIEMLKRFEPKEDTRNNYFASVEDDEMVKKSEIRANEFLNKLNRLYEKMKAKPPRTFLGRVLKLAKIEFLEEAVKMKKEANIKMASELKEEASSFTEEYASLEQKSWEKKRELEEKACELRKLDEEFAREKQDYDNGKDNWEVIFGFGEGSLNNRIGWLGGPGGYIEKLEEEIKQIEAKTSEIRKNFERHKMEINKKYGENLFRDNVRPAWSILAKSFRIGFKEIIKVGSSVVDFVADRFKKHEEKKSEKQDAFRKRIDNRSKEFQNRVLFKPEETIDPQKINDSSAPKRETERSL